jgi:hypothetical protein
MKITEKNKVKGNDDSDVHNNEIGENTGEDTLIAKAAKADEKDKSKSATSNKGQGPSGENL